MGITISQIDKAVLQGFEIIAEMAKQEFDSHHLACKLEKECYADCPECFKNDLLMRLQNELKINP